MGAENSQTAEEMGAQLRRTVVLVGMMGSGKTAIGRTLAARLGVPFLDSDAELEAAANANIAEIFERDGEAFFRDREAEVILRLLSGPPVILSTGGGAFLAERNRQAISEKGMSLWLNVDLATLWERVRHKDTRPLLRTADPYQTLSDLLAARESIYAMADMAVTPGGDYSIDQTTDLVMQALSGRPEILET